MLVLYLWLYAVIKNENITINYFFISFCLNAQIKGQIMLHSKTPYPGARISDNDDFYTTETDFDGYFEFNTSSKEANFDLIIHMEVTGYVEDSQLSIVIKNIPKESKINLGQIYIPEYKSVSINKYKKLSKSEKENCRALYHYNTFLTYVKIDEFKEGELKLNCSKNQKTNDFKTDMDNRSIYIKWERIFECI